MGGVAVLMPATLFTKVIGLFYKIPLIAIVGVEGMAYFLAAYHLYSLLFVISATGLPTALSLQIARAVAGAQSRSVGRIFRASLLLFLSLGLLGTLGLLLGASCLAERLAMSDAAAAIVAIAPALLLSAFIGAAKGYFQGHQRMLPTALSEVLEASGKLGFGLCFALIAKSRGADTPRVAAAAILGITAGLALAALLLAVWLLYHAAVHRPCDAQSCSMPKRGKVLAELLRVALPITVSASVMSVVSLIDTALISSRLQKIGFAPGVANAMYSSYGNLAVPLYNLVPSLLSPITLALMPLLGGALSRRDLRGGRSAFKTAFRISALLSIPAALGLAVFSRPILSLIYHGQSEAIAVAAPALSLLALAVVPAVMIALVGAALQAMGHTLLPVVAMSVGALIKLAIEFSLLSVPGVYIYAAPISTVLCNLAVLLIEGIALARVFDLGFLRAGDLFRPLLAAVLSVGAGGGAYFALRALLGECLWQMPLVLLLAALLFLPFALCLGALGREELMALPLGDRLCRLLERCKLLK